jgi:VCBS repeat-containing protein
LNKLTQLFLSSLILLTLAFPLKALAQSISEIVQQGSTSVQEINSISRDVNSLLQQAQGSGDSVLLQCISTKQASISALKDISEVAMSSLESTSDLDKAAYELRKITLSLSKVRQFGSEASKCSSGSSQNENEGGSSQLSDAEAVVSRGERLASRITAMVAQAQREKDIIRVNCLDDKLAQVNANIRTAKSRLNRMRSTTDPQSLMQARTVMMVLGQKFQVLDQESSQCVGQNVFETGSTELDTVIDNATVPTDSCNPACDPGQKCKVENNVAKCVSDEPSVTPVAPPAPAAAVVVPPPLPTTCPEGQYADGKTCKANKVCTGKEYWVAGANGGTCIANTVCKADEYWVAGDNGGSCKANKVCTDKEYWVAGANGGTCIANTVCKADEYWVAGDNGGSCKANKVCTDKEYWVAGANGGTCNANTVCQSGEYWVAGANGGSCKANAVCTDKQYWVAGDNGGSCKANAVCTDKQYWVAGDNGGSCKANAVCTDKEYFVAGDNGGTCKANAVCTDKQHWVAGANGGSCKDNTAPVANDDVYTIAADSKSTVINVLGNDTDADKDKLTVSAIDKKGTKGFVGLYKGVISYDPNKKFESLGAKETDTDTFTYTVSDGKSEASATVTIKITGKNNAPVVKNPISDQAATEGTPFNFKIPASTFSDVNVKDKLTYSLTGLPKGLAFDGVDTIKGTPDKTAVDSHEVSVTANDGKGGEVSTTFKLTVKAAPKSAASTDLDADGFKASLDCNDKDPNVNPGAAEMCSNGVDDDCNPATPDIFDADSDGSNCNLDCDDTNANSWPGNSEICGDGIDNDCDPSTPDDCEDAVSTAKASDLIVSLAAANVKQEEGSSSKKEMNFAVTLSAKTKKELVLPYTIKGTGENPVNKDDFTQSLEGEMTIDAGSDKGTLSIEVKGDEDEEEDETFTVTLGDAPDGVKLGANKTATGTIEDDDDNALNPSACDSDDDCPGDQVCKSKDNSGPVCTDTGTSLTAKDTAPIVSIATKDGKKQEVSESSKTPLSFTVSLSQAASKNLSIPYTVTGIDANDVNEALKGALAFAKGDKSKDLVLTVKDDDVVEENETFTVTLGVAPDGVKLGDKKTAIGTILNDDNKNSAPIAEDDAKTYSADSKSTVLTVLENDTDPDNDKLTVSKIDKKGTKGYVGLTNGVISYDPNNKFNDLEKDKTEKDSFTYTLSDGNGGTDTATVTIMIYGVKEKPLTTSVNSCTPAKPFQCSDGSCKSTAEACATTSAKSASSKTETAEGQVVEKVVSIKQKEGKTEFKEGTDKEIIFTVTLSCPDKSQVECSVSKCASTYSVCPGPSSGSASSSLTQVESKGVTAVKARDWKSAIGSKLSYTWSAACNGGLENGSFDDATKIQTNWTAPINITEQIQTCALNLKIAESENEKISTTFILDEVEVNTFSCPEGQFLDAAGSCKDCPEGALCLKGTTIDTMKAAEGAW